MENRLFVFIGGSDEVNGDYSAVQRRAGTKGTMNWSALKDSCPGDRALIYIQRPHSALIAKAEVLGRAVKGAPGDYAYRAKVGKFELLPNRLGIEALKKEFPRWAWLKLPRGKAIVPAQYADKLWKLVHQKRSSVQILIANADFGQDQIIRMADTGKSAYWYAPRLTARDDIVLFYVEHPISAIVAVGKALSRTRSTNEKWYEAKVGEVRLLNAPITLSELRRMFPNWAWLRNVNMFAYLDQHQSRTLLRRIDDKPSIAAREELRRSGAGFGNNETNSLVERAAIRKAIRLLKQKGFMVTSRERESIGYDLDARRGRTELHVEVKGVSDDVVQFPITRNEVFRATSDPSFRLFVVTDALNRGAHVHEFKGRELHHRFDLQPISYMASKVERSRGTRTRAKSRSCVDAAPRISDRRR
jgi:hypothetical protein